MLDDEPYLPLCHIPHSAPEISNQWLELQFLEARMALVAGSWEKFDEDKTEEGMEPPHKATRMAHKTLPPVSMISSAAEGSRSGSPPPNRWRGQWLHPGWPVVTDRCMIDITCPCHTAGGFVCSTPCLMGYTMEDRGIAQLISEDTGDPAVCEYHWQRCMNSGFDPRSRHSEHPTPKTTVPMDVGPTPTSNPSTPDDPPPLVRMAPQSTPTTWPSSSDSNPESRVSYRGTPHKEVGGWPITRRDAATVLSQLSAESQLTRRVDITNGSIGPIWTPPYGPPTRPRPVLTSGDFAQAFGASTPSTPPMPVFPTKDELEIAEIIFQLLNNIGGPNDPPLPTVRVTFFLDDLLFDTADGSAIRTWTDTRRIIEDVLTRRVPDPRWSNRRHTFRRSSVSIGADFAELARASTLASIEDTTSAPTVPLLEAPPTKTPAVVTSATVSVVFSIGIGRGIPPPLHTMGVSVPMGVILLHDTSVHL